MRKIALSQRKYALVDDRDFATVSKRHWHWTKRGDRSGYAVNKQGGRNLYLHRFLMRPGKSQVVDHRNGDGLDNRRSNLRVCSQSENVTSNRRQRIGWKIRNGRWTAQISKNGKRQHLGYFDTQAEAEAAHRQAAAQLHGAFART